MKFEDLRKSISNRQLAKDIGVSQSGLWMQIHERGFSANTARQLKNKYPDLDLNDLLTNYPQRTKGIHYE